MSDGKDPIPKQRFTHYCKDHDFEWVDGSPIHLCPICLINEREKEVAEKFKVLEAEVAELKAGKEKAPDLEMRYRRLLWETHFHDGRYGDDGEMQCIECLEFGAIDYKREPLEKIERACREALILRAMKSKGRRAS
jgi:hypothetical protein